LLGRGDKEENQPSRRIFKEKKSKRKGKDQRPKVGPALAEVGPALRVIPASSGTGLATKSHNAQ